MATVGLEISDVGVLAAGGDPRALLQVDGDRSESPGIALLHKKKILVGWEAKRRERLYPRQCTDRFWSMLSTEPLQERGLAAGNYAELAVAHLEAIAKTLRIPEPQWVVAVPEFLDQGKLGILLGAAKALGIPVQGFVSSAVAAVQPVEEGSATLHVDVHLHRVELTLVEQGERLKRVRTGLITDSGWERLEDRVARRLADEFVQATRFDPLHEATAEQNLYDQLPGLMQRVRDGQPAPAELKLGESIYRIAVSAGMVTEACEPLCAKVLESVTGIRDEVAGEAAPLDVQFSHRAARVPGLVQRVGAEAGVEVTVLPPGAAALGALAMEAELADDVDPVGVNFLSSKARAAAITPPADAFVPGSQPTHLLLGDQAYPIGAEPLYVVEAEGGAKALAGNHGGEAEPLYSVRRVEGQVVVDPADADVQLIHVHPNREA